MLRTQAIFGGRVDYWVGRITDFFLGFPQQLCFIAVMPGGSALSRSVCFR